MTDDEEFEPYLDMAEERLLQSQGDVELKAKVDLVLAKIWFAKASNQVEQDIPELAVKALAVADESVENLPSKDVIDLADIVQNHGALYTELEHRNKFLEWAEKHLKKITKGKAIQSKNLKLTRESDEPENARALSTFGLTKLQTAHYWLDNTNEEEEEEKTELSKEEENAYKAILDCKLYLESAHKVLEQENKVTPQILFDLAEIYVNEANLILNEQEQNEIYEKAVKTIKQSQSLIDEKKLDDVLPEGLVAFLEEYETL